MDAYYSSLLFTPIYEQALGCKLHATLQKPHIPEEWHLRAIPEVSLSITTRG